MLDRRRFLQLTTGAALASGAAPAWPRRANAQPTATLVDRARAAGEDRLVIGAGAGAYIDRVAAHFFDPFTEATGIAVHVVSGSMNERVARLRAMDQIGAVDWDVISLSFDEALNPAITPLLADLGDDCGALPNVVANGLDGACLRHGVLFDVGGMVLAYDARAFPGPGPRNWADFWDVDRFPGPRAFPNYGAPWQVLEVALLADGVPRDALFPLDVDRAFRKLDALRPHITVFWSSGDQNQQIFRTQEVVMAMSFSGRAGRLRVEEGLPIVSVWDGAPFDAGVFCATAGAPRPNAALAFLDFTYTRPSAHAAYMVAANGATAMRGAADLVDPEFGRTLASHPDNWSGVVRMDPAWLAEHRDTVMRRWTAWLAE